MVEMRLILKWRSVWNLGRMNTAKPTRAKMMAWTLPKGMKKSSLRPRRGSSRRYWIRLPLRTRDSRSSLPGTAWAGKSRNVRSLCVVLATRVERAVRCARSAIRRGWCFAALARVVASTLCRSAQKDRGPTTRLGPCDLLGTQFQTRCAPLWGVRTPATPNSTAIRPSYAVTKRSRKLKSASLQQMTLSLRTSREAYQVQNSSNLRAI
mmetsp:Transcript_4798/g.12865  ORF Transcript_4798/g.12865 Transcript_4798/m.12865 type:complete len:208 (+) Transcript_4798:233-856(+)